MTFEDCHYNDHNYRGGGACVWCGHRLRCYCGCFVREDGIEAHMERCRLLAPFRAQELEANPQSADFVFQPES